jgi:hypothetical protein
MKQVPGTGIKNTDATASVFFSRYLVLIQYQVLNVQVLVLNNQGF